MTWFNESSNVPVVKRPGTMRSGLFSLMDDFLKDWDEDNLLTPIRGLRDRTDRVFPPLSISEIEGAYVVETELPGVKKKDITIDLYDNILTVKGEKKAFNEESKDQYYRMERSHGSFLRSIRLPTDVDSQKVSAKMEDGVLHIEISKSLEAAKKKRVTIN